MNSETLGYYWLKKGFENDLICQKGNKILKCFVIKINFEKYLELFID
jgi:hypothetical protein